MDKQKVKHTQTPGDDLNSQEESKQESIKENSLSFSGGIFGFTLRNKFILLFILLVVIVSWAIWTKIYHPVSTQQLTEKKTVEKDVLVKRSVDMGIINRGLTGKAVDVNTGKIISAARIFSPTDKTVYLELDFSNAPKGTTIDYIRYKSGRYVDHGEIVIPADDTKNILFDWTISNLLSKTREGQWKVATYANGILAKRIDYEVKNNKVAYVFPEEQIYPSDSDYRLTDVIVQNKPQAN